MAVFIHGHGLGGVLHRLWDANIERPHDIAEHGIEQAHEARLHLNAGTIRPIELTVIATIGPGDNGIGEVTLLLYGSLQCGQIGIGSNELYGCLYTVSLESLNESPPRHQS